MSANVDQSFFGIHEQIILTKNGVWLSNGEEITHGGTVRAFSKNIFRSPDGYEIRLGTERKSIHIEDTMFFITHLDGSAEIGFNLILNDGRTVELKPETLQYKPGRLTARVQNPNDHTQDEAKFLSTAYYELLKYVEHEKDGFCITIEKKKFILSRE